MRLYNCIYRFLNKDNEIIYIGKAKDLKRRLVSHNHLPEECYKERVEIEFCMFDTEDDMDLAERYFIPKYRPKYNTVLNNRVISVAISEFDNMSWITIKDYENTQRSKLQIKKDKYITKKQKSARLLRESIIKTEYKKNLEFEIKQNKEIIDLCTGQIFKNIHSFKEFSKTHWDIQRLIDYCDGDYTFLNIKHPQYYATSMIPRYLDEFKSYDGDKDWERQFIRHTRSIICLTTKEVFNNSYEAQDRYMVTSIINCCNGKANYTGTLDNKPLVWKWYDEYLDMTQADIDKYMNNAYEIYTKRNRVA